LKVEAMPSHYKGTKAEVEALSAFINLVRAADSLQGKLSRDIESRGVTLPQFGVLEALLHRGPMCQRAIGEKLLRTGGNVTLVIDNLEKRGWVRRERRADDRRMVMVELTAKGRKLIERIFPGHARTVEREMSVLGPEEQEKLRELCRKLGKADD
jgi:MarR family transcriptional regulator, 2-MHQ and catechol-resistance regulon repressor